MQELDELLLEAEDKMQKTIAHFESDLTQIRTGRANPKILDKVQITYYGVPTPLAQVSQINVIEGTQLFVKPYDKSLLKDLEHAILAENLDMPVNSDGVGVRIIFPKLTEDRRKALAKDVEKAKENAKVFIRNSRRDLNDQIKKAKYPEDLEKEGLDEAQKLTDKYTAKIDEIAQIKTKEVMSIWKKLLNARKLDALASVLSL